MSLNPHIDGNKREMKQLRSLLRQNKSYITRLSEKPRNTQLTLNSRHLGYVRQFDSRAIISSHSRFQYYMQLEAEKMETWNDKLQGTFNRLNCVGIKTSILHENYLSCYESEGQATRGPQAHFCLPIKGDHIYIQIIFNLMVEQIFS